MITHDMSLIIVGIIIGFVLGSTIGAFILRLIEIKQKEEKMKK